jgi:crotonobetaine/carnitine-CoA ligase
MAWCLSTDQENPVQANYFHVAGIIMAIDAARLHRRIAGTGAPFSFVNDSRNYKGNRMNNLSLLAELQSDGEIATERLDKWAREIGDRPFFIYGEDDITLTFAEFGRLTDAIAGNFAAKGIVKGDRVSVFMRNPLITTMCMFGIWKAGAVFCPINFGFTGKLLAYQIGDTKPKLMLTERSMVARLNDISDNPANPVNIVVYDAPPGSHDHVAERTPLAGTTPELAWDDFLRPATRPAIALQFDDVANIIYTSGTTGPPKGVVQSHRWMNQYCFIFRQLLNQEDIVYNDLPLYHVGGAFFNIVRALWVGCAVACWDRFSPKQFWSRIARSKASTAVLIDTMIPWLVNAAPDSNDRNNTLNKVYFAPLPKYHEEVARRFAFDFVATGFGQTESGMSLLAIIEETDVATGTPPEFRRGLAREAIRAIAERYGVPVIKPEAAARKGHMGRPSPFVEATVLDERDQECAPETVGQLALRPKLPALLLLEYLGKPEATAKAFRNLWFHTGDTVRRETNGTFTFVDRMGDRIRVRGENVSSYEIEDIISKCPGVMVSAAFPIPAEEGDEDDVVVLVVAKAGATLSEQIIKSWAEQQMPKFMRPRYVRIVAELPLTLTQKIEKYKLRAAILKELGRS